MRRTTRCRGAAFGLWLACAALRCAAEETPSPPKASELIRGLGAEEFKVRERATEELSKMGPDIIPLLEKAAGSEDPEVRVRAARALEKARWGVTPEWPADMVELAKDYAAAPLESRIRTLRVLQSRLGEFAVPFLVSRLAGKNSAEAGEALRLLKAAKGPRVAETVVRLLPDPRQPSQRAAKAWALSELGREAEAWQFAGDRNGAGLRGELLEKMIRKAQAQLKQGPGREALETTRQLCEAEPRDARVLYLRAEALAASGSKPEAEALRAKALALNPDSEERHFGAAMLLEDLGRFDLAEREWQAVLKIPPADQVCDINACFRLGNIRSMRGEAKGAAELLEKGLRLYRQARKEGQGMGIVGADEAAIEKTIRALRQAQGGAAAPGNAGDGGGPDLAVQVEVRVKDGQAKMLERALKDAAGTFVMNVEPWGLRLFDQNGVVLRYDAAKGEFAVLLNGSPCAPPRAVRLAGEMPNVAVQSLDCVYIFKLNRRAGQANLIARFEKDYVVRLRPGKDLSQLRDVKAQVNGKARDWEKLLKGEECDYLPREMEIAVTGRDADGAERRVEKKIPLEDPPGPKGE